MKSTRLCERTLTRAQLFAAAMMLYPRWYDPHRDALCDLETAMEALAAETRAWRADHRGWVASGMRLWKRQPLQRVFGQWKAVLNFITDHRVFDVADREICIGIFSHVGINSCSDNSLQELLQQIYIPVDEAFLLVVFIVQTRGYHCQAICIFAARVLFIFPQKPCLHHTFALNMHLSNRYDLG